MPSDQEIQAKFWKAVKSDRTVMLGLTGVDDGMSQPMTALLAKDAEDGPLWIFSSSETNLVQALGQSHRALIHFSSKGHDLFATVDGDLSLDQDRARIEELWNPHVAAWYEGGKDDPKLRLLRFDGDHAQIWLNENSLFAGVKMMLGRDPKQDYKDKVADVRL